MKIDLAIKFGSNEIIIYRKGIGIVASEPAFLAVEENGKKIKVKAVGKKAEQLFMSKSSSVTVYKPIVNSEIVNEKFATILISEILKEVIKDKFFLTSINAIVSVPCALNEQALYTLKKVLQSSGLNRITFVQNSVCAREYLDLPNESHIMVVDIGKYITDISVLNSTDFNFGRLYYFGGYDMDKSITTFIMDNHGLEVSDLTSEAIKNEVSSLYDRDTYKTEYIGIDSDNKFVKNEISASEVKVAIVNIYDKIFNFIKDVLKTLPREICADVYNNGVLFVGGASSISGMYEYAKKKLDLPILVLDNPTQAVVLGAGKLLSKKDYIKINF